MDDETRAALPAGRMDAARARSKLYIGGKCIHGHDGLRYTRNGSCVQCTRDAAAANREEIRKLLAGDGA